MQHVALTAAIFAGAFFLVPGSSSVTTASIADAANINSIIAKPKTTEPAARQPQSPARVQLASAKKAEPAQPTAQPAKTVTVAAGDSLSKIAQESGTTYVRLYDANTSVTDPDLIYPGQQLRIPAADEQLASRPIPVNAPPEVKQEAQAAANESAPAPAPRRQAVAAPSVAGGSVWDSLAQCESGGNWAINTGNGYYGGLQFTPSSWAAVGGSGLPNQASREEQIMRGQMLQSIQGWGAWPACAAKLGLL